MPDEASTTLTEEEFDEVSAERGKELVGEAVAYQIAPDDYADEYSEAAKRLADEWGGDIEDHIRESIDRALREKRDRVESTDEAAKWADFTDFGGGTPDHGTRMKMADALDGHWLSDKMGDQPLVGEGKLMADTTLFVMRSMIDNAGRLDWEYVREQAEQEGVDHVAKTVEKNLQDTDFSQGGALVPPEFSGDVIGFLHGSTALRGIDPQTVEFSSELVQGRISGTATAHYRGEGGAVNSSTQNTDQIKFSENQLVVRVIQSRRFARNASQGQLQIMRDDMRNVVRTKEESTLLRSSGGQNEPTGILHQVNSSNKYDIDSTDPNTPDQVIKDLLKAQKLVHADGKVPRDRPSYIMPEAVFLALQVFTDSDNNLSSLAMMAREGDIFGVPVQTTNQIPIDLGGGNDESEIYYIEASQYVIAEATDLEVRELSEATISDSSGSDRKLAERDEIAVEMTMSQDAQLRHDVGAAVAEKVDWHTQQF